MTSISPLVIAATVIVTLAIVGAIILFVRSKRVVRDYGEIAKDVKSLAERLGGEVFRDADDLVVSGEFQKMPTILRFSNSNNTPALQIETRIPAAIQVTVSPKHLPDTATGAKVKLPSLLDHKFVAKSNDPREIEMLLEQQSTVALLMGLCCSRRTVVQITRGKLRLAEMVIPTSLFTHVINHLREIGDLSAIIRTLPGSDAVKIVPIPRERSSWPLRAVIAVGVLIAVVSVMAATRSRSKPKIVAPAVSTVRGIVPVDAAAIPFSSNWRTADVNELPTSFISWVMSSGQQVRSRYEFASDGTGTLNGVAYLLTNHEGAKRVVALVDHKVVFDSTFKNLAGCVRIPAASIPRIPWDATRGGREKPSGDGILLVRDADDPHSGVVIYFQDGTLRSASPVDYRSISLQ